MEIGPLFREFRLNKHLKLNQTADGIVTTQFLRKFEKNESDISTSKFFELLQRINVSVEEFSFQYFQNINIITIDKLERQIDEAKIKNSKHLWEKLLIESQERLKNSEGLQNKFNYYLDTIIHIHCNLSINTNYTIDDKSIITYLESIETWGKTEFFLGNYISTIQDTKTLVRLWHLAFSKKIDSPIIQKYSVDFYLHICLFLLKNKEMEITRNLMRSYDVYQKPTNILQNLSFNCYNQFLKGLMLALENDPNGKKICYKMINFFRNQVIYTDYANQMEHVFIKYTS